MAMDESAQVSRLIGYIYEAALDPALWPVGLQQSAKCLGGIPSAGPIWSATKSRRGITQVTLQGPAATRERTQTGRSRHHQDWDFKSALPVLMAWLIFYVVVIVGSLSGTRPHAMTPPPVLQRSTGLSIR